ncbi:hypothetical protein CPLU01_09854 [Colletotrichum plurivorum]|uniref:Uncharacterized protein n=1 Tax=Colletotrichum plurivorum TaxID=2175906 RepID=A0A8H6K6U7_9PEZI|nr:hypothetical protein CPLU01_09854 [Colletotrichum plurivorum]
MEHRKSYEESVPLTAVATDLERGLDADVEPARPAADQDLGYRQRYIQNLAENIPSKKASVKEVKEFVTKVCVYREVADETVLSLNNGLLWTGEELHQLSKDDMVELFRYDFLSKSQAELVVKDIIDIRKRATAPHPGDNPSELPEGCAACVGLVVALTPIVFWVGCNYWVIHWVLYG